MCSHARELIVFVSYRVEELLPFLHRRPLNSGLDAYIYIYIYWPRGGARGEGNGGTRGGHVNPLLFFIGGGGNGMFVPPPHTHF